uniref:SFRICE_018003 n=1 Tax=Spodoptera frugiperda TaxID=7108 RepID=A0A2H1VL11_SPOFR
MGTGKGKAWAPDLITHRTKHSNSKVAIARRIRESVVLPRSSVPKLQLEQLCSTTGGLRLIQVEGNDEQMGGGKGYEVDE